MKIPAISGSKNWLMEDQPISSSAQRWAGSAQLLAISYLHLRTKGDHNLSRHAR
jgi:hypothetical protein